MWETGKECGGVVFIFNIYSERDLITVHSYLKGHGKVGAGLFSVTEQDQVASSCVCVGFE